ncbi:N-acetyltransferase family protein [Planctomicrobium sp. SH527]|uniref:GNAT family N-acetyltransferase n=1 Tax=Planctomicrobium sp. SH527 TaxID=3448123 RepID=UPI003F5AE61B
MHWISDYQLQDGTLVRFRHVTPADAEMIADSIRTASPETLLHRFFSPITSVPIPVLKQLLDINPKSDLCFLGQAEINGETKAICGARYVRQNETTIAEIAITVHDDFQHRGLGTYLIRKLAELAAEQGIEQFEAIVMSTNTGMLRLIESVSPRHERFYLGDTIRLLIPITDLISP